MRVRAIEAGYYGFQRRKIGEEFTISSRKAFSEKWMVSLEKEAPKKEVTEKGTMLRRTKPTENLTPPPPPPPDVA